MQNKQVVNVQKCLFLQIRKQYLFSKNDGLHLLTAALYILLLHALSALHVPISDYHQLHLIVHMGM